MMSWRRPPWAGCLLIAVSLLLGVAAFPGAAHGRAGETLAPTARGTVLQASEKPRVPAGPKGRRSIPLLVPAPARLRREKAEAARELPRFDRPSASRRRSPVAGRAPAAAVFGGLNELGLSAGSGSPPDSTGAIGPSHYVEMVNTEIGVFARADLSLTASADLDDFVGAPGEDVFDPQVQWDPDAERWLYVADDVAGPGDNFLAIGWSKTSDPSDLVSGWCNFFIDTDADLHDYPKLGHNDTHMIIGANVFDDSGGPTQDDFLTAAIWAVPKPAGGDMSCAAPTAFLFSGSPLETADGDPVFTPVPANTADDPAANVGYVVAADSPFDVANPDEIMAWHISGASGSPLLTEDGNMTVTAYDFPANVPQPRTRFRLDSLDARLTQAVALADPDASGAEAVWTQHTVDGPGGRSVVRWYELLPSSGTVRQQGTLGDPNHFVFNAAISPAANGTSAAINHNVGGSSQLVQARAKSRRGTTPLGSMTGEITLATSAAADRDFTCSPCRWGDYAGASPDPLGTDVVWGSNQLNGPFTSDPHWLTRNFALSADAPDTIAPETQIDSGPAEGSTIADSTPSFSFAANESSAAFDCQVDSGGFSPCSSPKTIGPLADGQHTFQARAKDEALNIDPTPASRTFTVDTTIDAADADPPQTTITKAPKKKVKTKKKRAKVKFRFTSDESGSSFECRLNARLLWRACSSPKKHRLRKGKHTFRVRATDPAGNTDPTPAKRKFKVKKKRKG